MFIISVPSDLGDIQQLEIWHNNGGSSPGWFLQEAKVSVHLCGTNLKVIILLGS